MMRMARISFGGAIDANQSPNPRNPRNPRNPHNP
jgi:hypothetical protein